MKTNWMFRFAGMFLLITAIALVGYAVVGALSYGLFTGGLTVLATGGAAAGTFTTDTATTQTATESSTNLLERSISKKITQMKPSLYPLDTIAREIGLAETMGSWQYAWYEIDQRDITDTVKTTKSSTGTSSGVNQVHTLAVNNITNWSIDDNILVVNINGGDSKTLVLHVVAKDSANDILTVLALNGTGTNARDLPEIVSTTPLVCIGNAKAELDAQTTPYQAYPQDKYNYAQIHMAQIEQSVYEKLHTDKEVNWGMNDYRAQSIYDMRRKAELTNLFGVRGKFYDPIGQDYKYMSNGITKLITKGLEYNSTSITNSTFAGWGRQIFTGNSGSEKRLLFVGGKLNEYLLGVPTIQKQIDAGSTEVVWGIRFNKIDCGFGELLVKYHNLFDTVGWDEKGLVLDVNYIERAVFKPMATRKLKLQEAGSKNADAEVLEEAYCLATRYPDLHAIISKNNG